MSHQTEEALAVVVGRLTPYGPDPAVFGPQQVAAYTFTGEFVD